MTVIEFLSDYAQLVLSRARHELPDVPITILYTEDSAKQDDGSTGYVATATLTGPDGGSVDIAVGFPLYAELNHQYKPVMSDEEWSLLRDQITAKVAA